MFGCAAATVAAAAAHCGLSINTVRRLRFSSTKIHLFASCAQRCIVTTLFSRFRVRARTHNTICTQTHDLAVASTETEKHFSRRPRSMCYTLGQAYFVIRPFFGGLFCNVFEHLKCISIFLEWFVVAMRSTSFDRLGCFVVHSHTKC